MVPLVGRGNGRVPTALHSPGLVQPGSLANKSLVRHEAAYVAVVLL
jgi:hypothetical protein